MFAGARSRILPFAPPNRRASFEARPREPLRILFCGSDIFSQYSLDALYNEYKSTSARIASLDVLCRPGKRVGRGLKQVRSLPIANAARRLELPLHEIDTFTGWELPQPNGHYINLVIAVSFGLLIPSRILKSCAYGGLNVHPSILPEFRGPAPLHHTLLDGRQRSGVSVQTLHPKHFDRGLVLHQTAPPGFIHGCNTVPELIDRTGKEGAEMLLHCIRQRSFATSSAMEGDHTFGNEVHGMKLAPKITSRDRHVNWVEWDADKILRRCTVIGPLWSELQLEVGVKPKTTRLIWSSGFSKVENGDVGGAAVGVPFVERTKTGNHRVLIPTSDGQLLKAQEITLDGQVRDDPLRSAVRAGCFSGKDLPQPTEAGGNTTRQLLFKATIL